MWTEVIPVDCRLVEVETPDFGHLVLRGGQLLVLLTNVKLLLNWQKMLNCVEVVLHLIEDTSDVIDCDGSLSVVLRLGVAAPMVL